VPNWIVTAQISLQIFGKQLSNLRMANSKFKQRSAFETNDCGVTGEHKIHGGAFDSVPTRNCHYTGNIYSKYTTSSDIRYDPAVNDGVCRSVGSKRMPSSAMRS
jgi:hypothetical protein